MPSPTISRLYNHAHNASSPLSFEDTPQIFTPDTDPMLFGPLDMDVDDLSFHHEPSRASTIPFPWNTLTEGDQEVKSPYSYTDQQLFMPNYDFGHPLSSPTDSYFDSAGYYTPEEFGSSPAAFDSNLPLAAWTNESLESTSPTSPIPIPTVTTLPETNHPFVSYLEPSQFPIHDPTFSPATFAALHPLPASVSPPSSFREQVTLQQTHTDSVAPQDTSLQVPTWSAAVYDSPSPVAQTRPLSISGNTRTLRAHNRRNSIPSAQLFISSSAPSYNSAIKGTPGSRYYTRRADSLTPSAVEDRDATIRRRRKTSAPEQSDPAEKANETPPLKPILRPPKLAPSAWQLYFTDWIQRQQASNTRKLNVAQAAKEAGQEYASLSTEEKEPYKRRSQAMKEAREREYAAYMRTLTPEDIKRENAYRTAQRKAGKSRKSNIKDPNAPKKPLSAYFMFLQRIRSDPQMVQEVFGDETETTKQSVLAAAKWRSMSDDERKPFLAQAEQEKMEYEAARRLYEEGTPGYGSFNFSILPGSPAFQIMKMESESESEGLIHDEVYTNR